MSVENIKIKLYLCTECLSFHKSTGLCSGCLNEGSLVTFYSEGLLAELARDIENMINNGEDFLNELDPEGYCGDPEDIVALIGEHLFTLIDRIDL